jgi:hypothetical protein
MCTIQEQCWVTVDLAMYRGRSLVQQLEKATVVALGGASAALSPAVQPVLALCLQDSATPAQIQQACAGLLLNVCSEWAAFISDVRITVKAVAGCSACQTHPPPPARLQLAQLPAEDGDTCCAWVSWIGSQQQQGADAVFVCVLRVMLPGADAQVCSACCLHACIRACSVSHCSAAFGRELLTFVFTNVLNN